jgi:hypothetical protein
VAENEKTGILTNGEQDKKIFDLYTEVALQNERLKITNDRLEKVCDCLETQDKRIQKLEKEVTRHSVYISLVTMGIGILITQFITKVWSIVGR